MNYKVDRPAKIASNFTITADMKMDPVKVKNKMVKPATNFKLSMPLHYKMELKEKTGDTIKPATNDTTAIKKEDNSFGIVITGADHQPVMAMVKMPQ